MAILIALIAGIIGIFVVRVWAVQILFRAIWVLGWGAFAVFLIVVGAGFGAKGLLEISWAVVLSIFMAGVIEGGRFLIRRKNRARLREEYGLDDKSDKH